MHQPFRLDDADLKRSVRGLGPLLPYFVRLSGEPLDGQRRKAICDQHKIPIETVAVSPARVKPLLFLLHPERINRDDYPDPKRALQQCATDCWVSPSVVARAWLATPPEAQLTGRWQRLATAFRVALEEERIGNRTLTPEHLVGIVRRTL